MYSKVHPSAYSTPCVASNSGIELAKDAPSSAATMIAKPTVIEGPRIRGHRCIVMEKTGEAKYATPVAVVPMAATLALEPENREWEE
jgi:hypothetical protein